MSNTTEPEDFEFSEEVNELAAEALAKIDSFANELESVDERISYLILTSHWYSKPSLVVSVARNS